MPDLYRHKFVVIHTLLYTIYIADFRVIAKRQLPFLTTTTQKQVATNMTGPP